MAGSAAAILRLIWMKRVSQYKGLRYLGLIALSGTPERIKTSVSTAAGETGFGTAEAQFNNDVVRPLGGQAELASASGFTALRLLG